MTDIRIAIISFEHMHAFSYANALKHTKGAKLVAVAESDPQRMELIKQQFPFVPEFFCEYHRMLEEAKPDAVVITSANAAHCQIALDCAAAKKHILCEKPIATNVADAVRMIQAARENKVNFMTAFPVRFSPAVREAKKMVRDGALGHIIGATTSNHGSMPGGWFVEKEKSGGGAVLDHTVHVADILRWLLEDEAQEVYAEYGTRLHAIPSDDVGQLLIRFKKGSFASLDTSWSRPKSFPTWGDVKLEIKGEKANISLNCFPRSMHFYDDRAMRHSSSFPGEDLDQLMVEEFLASIRENRQPEVTGEDGLRALEIALAAYQAGEKLAVAKVDLAAI